MHQRSRALTIIGSLVALAAAVLPPSAASADDTTTPVPTAEPAPTTTPTGEPAPTPTAGPDPTTNTKAPSPSESYGSSSSKKAPASSNTTVAPNIDEIDDVNTKIDILVAQMLAAADAHVQTQGQLANAQTAAATAEQAYNESVAALNEATLTAQDMAHDLYIQGPLSMSKFALLDSAGPQDLIDQLVTLDHLTSYQATTLINLSAAQANTTAAKEAAKASEAQMAAAETAAAAAEQDIQTQLAAQQAKLAQLQSEAGIAPDAGTTGGTGAPGAPGAVTGNWALPATGTLTSHFESRWGTFHYGIDIAAPIGTPIYAAGNGIVKRAGEASGFGLAVYIQHDNGDVTVYGHVNQIFVTEGQRVTAGQNIASVGNRGYSTGPHLHFEVQLGIYGTRIDPLPWLASRGISV